MAGRDKESQEIMSAAMRFVRDGDRTDLESYSIELLRKADYQLSDRDIGSGYRRAISDRIEELKGSISHTDVVDIKPNFFGLGLNLNEAWRRLKSRFSK